MSKNKGLFLLVFVFFVGVSLFVFVGEEKVLEQEVSLSETLTIRENEHYLSFVDDSEYTVVEYLDFDCVFCRRLHLELDKGGANYSKITYIVRSFPSTGVALYSKKALIAECVYDQSGDEGYLAFIDIYFKTWGNKRDFTWITKIAEDLVADKNKLNDCIANNQTIKDTISNNFMLDSIAGVTQTPSFYIYRNNTLEQKYVGLGAKTYRSLMRYYSRNGRIYSNSWTTLPLFENMR